MSNFEREVWLDALALAYEKGMLQEARKKSLSVTGMISWMKIHLM